MSEMPMATATGSMRAEPRGPYSDRHGAKSPEEMPEVAREVIMLRGAAISIATKINEVEANIAELREKVSPVSDRREHPEPAPVLALDREVRAQSVDQPVSDLATDLRVLQKMLNESVEHLEALATRVWSIARDVQL